MTAAPPRRAVGLLLLGLFLAAASARPQLVGIGPLLGRVQDDLGVSHATAGLLATIPVLCMGLFAPVGPVVLARLGAAAGVGLCLALVAGGGLLRVIDDSLAPVLVATLVLGMGMGMTGSALPVVVASRLRSSRTMATGFYVAGINVGSAVSSATAVPLADATGGWRGAMLVMSGATVLLVGAWLVMARLAGVGGRPPESARPSWTSRLRDRRVWRLIALFVCMAVAFYGSVAWLTDAYREDHGWSAASAGALIAVFNITSLPAALIVPWLADRHGTRRQQLLAVGALFVLGLVLLAGVPALAWPAAVVAGFANGGLFALVMVLPVDFAEEPAEVGVYAGAMLGAGYSIAAVAPVGLGAVRDLADSYVPVLWIIAGFSVALLAIIARLPFPAGRSETSWSPRPGAVAKPQ